MKRITYLLVLLPIWHQVDDTWVVAAEFFAASQAGIEDNEEYLPSERDQRAEECASHQKRRGVGANPSPADSPLTRTDFLSNRRPIAPYAPPPLYVFMSLQI
jgi:hypothetical protein